MTNKQKYLVGNNAVKKAKKDIDDFSLLGIIVLFCLLLMAIFLLSYAVLDSLSFLNLFYDGKQAQLQAAPVLIQLTSILFFLSTGFLLYGFVSLYFFFGLRTRLTRLWAEMPISEAVCEKTQAPQTYCQKGRSAHHHRSKRKQSTVNNTEQDKGDIA